MTIARLSLMTVYYFIEVFFLIQFFYNRNVISFSSFHAAILTFLIDETECTSA